MEIDVDEWEVVVVVVDGGKEGREAVQEKVMVADACWEEGVNLSFRRQWTASWCPA
jgi:hypothetical protein